MLPGIFEPTLFSGPAMALSPKPGVAKFVRAMHPKTEIQPTRAAVAKTLQAGWWGQAKIHGHRAQIHIPNDEALPLTAFNRQGQVHAKALSRAMERELRRLFQPVQGFTVIDSEWLKPQDQLFVFDLLRRDGRLLDTLTYADRYALLPRVYASAHIQTLPVLKTTASCMEVLGSAEANIEGLVFRAPAVAGFLDAAIIRCRR